MSDIALSNIQTIIERSIFERIRIELVDKGYLPDVTQYTNDASGVASYEADLDNIVATKGFAIEVYNESSSFEKGLKKVPRIVINSGNFLPGDIGGDPSRFYELGEDNRYLAKVTPPQTADFFFSIHLVSENVIQERVLNALLALSVPRRKYIPWYNDNRRFFVRNLNYFDLDDNDNGLIEKVFAYEVPDCWDMEDEVVATDIAKISHIKLNTNIQKYLEGSWSTDVMDIWNKLSINITTRTNLEIGIS